MATFMQLLDLYEDGLDCFVADSPAQSATRLFGGQVAAQALRAGCLTAPPGRWPHSLHLYFMRPGRPGVPVKLSVTRSRDGRSFSTRLITAAQHGEVILMMMASFSQREDGQDWQSSPLPEVPGPDQVPPAGEMLAWFSAMPSFEIRPVSRGAGASLHPCWVRLAEPLPEDPSVQACALTFMSDIGMVRAARVPGARHQSLSGASLDHALWLHRPELSTGWLLMSAQPACNVASRGLAVGTLHAQDGTLAASMSQEAVLRPTGTFTMA
jgi:acyl-CoA thioesterase II